MPTPYLGYKPYATPTDLKKDIQSILTEHETLSFQDNHAEDDELHRFKCKTIHTNNGQKTIVKLFNANLYTSPTQKDFIDRINSILSAAKIAIENHLTDTDKTEALAKIDALQSQTLLLIKNQTYAIKPTTINDNAQEENIKLIKKVRNLMQTLVYHTLFIINPHISNANELIKTLTELNTSESEMIADMGRPNHVNFYPIEQEHGDVLMRYSIQMTVSDKTIPSTIRNRAKLPNHVWCETGYMNGTEFVPDFEFSRHSSHTPIMIENNFERHQKAAICAKDLLIDLAKREIVKNTTDNPIILHISSLALLTSSLLDFRGKTNEHKQLAESYNALMLYDGREITINGRKIKPVINLMNTPVNALGIAATQYGGTSLENNINIAGMNRFISEAQRHLKKLPGFINLDNDQVNENSRKIEAFKRTLIAFNTALDEHLQKPNASDDIHYQTIINEINTCRHQINALERSTMNERKKMFKEQRDKIKDAIPANNELAELYYPSLSMYMDHDWQPKYGKIEPAQFGAYYLLAAQKMGHHVDFFCKSGEDRTGRMQNFLEELCAFKKQKGYYPRYDFNKKMMNPDDEKYRKFIALRVNAGSCSLENTRENAHGCPGLQISAHSLLFKARLNANLPCKPMKAMAGLAKNVYNKNVIKKLWAETLSFMENYSHHKHFSSHTRRKLLDKYEINNEIDYFQALLLETSKSVNTKKNITILSDLPEDEKTSKITASASTLPVKLKLKNNLNRLNTFQTMTGREIKTIGENRDVFEMDIPIRNPLADMKMLALRVEASGSNEIQMNIQEENKKRAKQLAQNAYKACREIGREPHEINLFINGKKISMSALFADDLKLKNKIDMKASMLKLERAALSHPAPLAMQQTEPDNSARKESFNQTKATIKGISQNEQKNSEIQLIPVEK